MISMLERFFYLLCEQWMQSLLGKNGKCQNQRSGIQFFIIICTQIEGFHGSSAGKESACNAGDPSSIPGLEKTLESPMDCKEIQPVHSKGDQSWVFFGRNDAKAETLVLWPPHAKSWLIGKDSDAGRDWGQEEKGTTEDEMAAWHHWFDGRESERTPGVGDGQGGLACYNSWGHKDLDITEQLNWTEDRLLK